MNPSLAPRLCCPVCRSELRMADGTPGQECVEEGAVLCSGCGHEYPVRSGIPVLLTGGLPGPQSEEQRSRDQLAVEWSEADRRHIWARLAAHHYLPAMKTAASRFAARFSEDQWALDIGVGWGWHWVGLTKPNVIAMDFSFSSLLIAKRLLGPQVDRNVHLVCADAGQLPFINESVEGIWTVQAFQHIPDPTLRQCPALCSKVQSYQGFIEIYWLN